jgi:hypothetical protein
MLALLASCASGHAQAGPEAPMTAPAPMNAAAHDNLCVTKGAIAGGKVSAPTVRAVALDSGGDRASLAFRFRGDSERVRALASGQERRQLGLKLRAENGCNLVYVMWRLDATPRLEISVKRNPGARTHADCGANGYTKVKAAASHPPPALEPDSTHTLRAEITGDDLTAWIDDHEIWRGALPDAVRGLVGPAGLRSDNVAYEIVELSAPGHAASEEHPHCHTEDSD